MGKRGPPKTPTATLKTRKTFRRDRHDDAIDVTLKPTLPNPPDYFDVTAKRQWNKIGAMLRDKGLLTQLDAIAFEMLITSYMGVVNTAKQLGESGSPAPNPLVGINSKMLATLKWCLTQFGCTPSARNGLKPLGPGDESRPIDPMESLIGGR